MKLQSHQKKGTINQEKISLRVLNSLSRFQDLGTKFFITATVKKYKLQLTTNLYKETTLTQNSVRHNVALGIGTEDRSDLFATTCRYIFRDKHVNTAC